MKTLLAALVTQAAALQLAGAIRSEHNVQWQAFRTALDQAHDAAEQPTPAATPDAAAFATLAGLVDFVSEKVDAIAKAVGVVELDEQLADTVEG